MGSLRRSIARHTGCPALVDWLPLRLVRRSLPTLVGPYRANPGSWRRVIRERLLPQGFAMGLECHPQGWPPAGLAQVKGVVARLWSADGARLSSAH